MPEREIARKVCCYVLNLPCVREEASSTLAALCCFWRGFERQTNASSRGTILLCAYMIILYDALYGFDYIYLYMLAHVMHYLPLSL